MKPAIPGSPVVLVAFAVFAFATAGVLGGCAAEANEPTPVDEGSGGVEMVGIGGDGQELPSPTNVAGPGAHRLQGTSSAPSVQTLTDDSSQPWQSVLGPVPDPWKGCKAHTAPTTPTPTGGSGSGGHP